MIREVQPRSSATTDALLASVERLLLSERDAAKSLSMSPRTLRRLTAPEGPIPCIRLKFSRKSDDELGHDRKRERTGRVLYSPSSLRAWVEDEHARQNPANGRNV